MLIKGLLVAVFLAILVFFVRNTGSHVASAWKRLLFVLFTFAAIAAVLFPDELTALANALGVGRGADLLLYATVAGLVLSLVTIYAKFKSTEEKLAEIARHVAILEVTLPKRDIA